MTGDTVICWTSDGQDGDTYGVFAQRFKEAGPVVSGIFNPYNPLSAVTDNTRPAKLFVWEHVRLKYACPKCLKTNSEAPSASSDVPSALSPAAIHNYLLSCRRFAPFYERSPEELGEAEVLAFLPRQREVVHSFLRQLSPGEQLTSAPNDGGDRMPRYAEGPGAR